MDLLEGARGLAISSDGYDVVVVCFYSKSVISFSRNARSTSASEAVPLLMLTCRLANSASSPSMLRPPSGGAVDLVDLVDLVVGLAKRDIVFFFVIVIFVF